MKKFYYLLLCFIGCQFVQAQELDTTMWVANQEVNAVLRVGNTIYLGGEFDYIGPNTGCAGVMNILSGETDTSFPRVNGRVNKSIPDGKGGWFLIGVFNNIGGSTMKDIAHIKSDHTLDQTWKIEADGQIKCLVLFAGVLYIGGTFHKVNGIIKSGIAALDSETGKLLDWKAKVSNDIEIEVKSIAISENRIFAGGSIRTSEGNQYLVAFDASTGQVLPWVKDFTGIVEQMLIYENTIYLSGSFDSIGGKSIKNFAAVDATTGIVKEGNPQLDVAFLKMWLYDNILYVAGNFTSIGGQARYRLASIDLKTGLTTDWKPDLESAQLAWAQALTVSGDIVYVGGLFYSGDESTGKIVAFDKQDGKLTSFRSKVSGPINTLSSANGDLLVGGDFNSMGGIERKYLAALDAITGKPLPWNPKPDNYVNSLASLGSTIYVGGSFLDSIGGQPRRYFAAVDAVTGMATAFQANANRPVKTIYQHQDKLFVTGDFDLIGGEKRKSIASLNAYTGQVTDWDAKIGIESYENATAVAIWKNTVFVSGRFNYAANETRHNLAAYQLDTGILTSWNPAINSSEEVSDIAVLNNILYISGNFTSIVGKPFDYLAGLNPETGQPVLWQPKVNGFVGKIVPWGDTTLLISGTFESTSLLHPEIASVEVNSGKVTYWNADLNDFDPNDNGYEYGSIQSIVPVENTIYIGGMFRTINGYVVSCGFAAFGQRPQHPTNSIKGNIFNDSNTNCVKEPIENSLSNLVIIAEPGGYYTSTDSLGNYELTVPTGKYNISQILPKMKGFNITQLCPVNPAYEVEFTSANQVITNKNFANEANIRPFLAVDISSDRRRRCFTSQTKIFYRNEGFASASNVQIKVVYPEYVIPISSSIPWKSRQGDTLYFELNTLLAQSSGSITITDSVACGNESIRGLTQCTQAIITPRNQLPQDNRWDQSSLRLLATCKDNGFVRLVIKNTGKGNMVDSTAYRIFLDAKLAFSAHCKVNSNDSLVLEVPVNGKTIRLEADQRPYHPGESKPSVTLEGCGSSATVAISKGFVDQLSQNDAGEEVSISCMEIRDSYDPNDKIASPAGAADNHLIGKEDELEYTIRFQNTGTDVAYKVVIEDELHENLDIATLRMGVSSHSNTWKISGEGKAKITWTFENINLPDSASNEKKSHGFVSFRIRQKTDNPIGASIANQAFITFDFNSPIATNVAYHTVGEFPPADAKIVVDICDGTKPDAAVAGNNIQLTNQSSTQLHANQAKKGYGRWKIISGTGNIINPEDPQTLITDLGVGKNVMEWSIYFCSQVSTSQVTIERIVIPTYPIVISPVPYCANDAIQPLLAQGKNIEWFADEALQTILATGESYQPTILQTDTFYVTQTISGYRSPARQVIVTIQPPVAAPIVPVTIYYCKTNQPVNITAEGENIEWFSDTTLQTKVGSGVDLSITIREDMTLYSTQQVNGCRSIPAAVTLKAGVFEPKQVFIANVITPNGDDKNEVFTAPQMDSGSCIGLFQYVQIFNRYGKKVYESRHEQFSWNGAGASTGVYYYILSYSGFTYSGTVSVLY